ncbi:DsbA family protein [Lichenicola cladoniae]|nr:DsbA family protein [Lichenicola cladoniae]
MSEFPCPVRLRPAPASARTRLPKAGQMMAGLLATMLAGPAMADAVPAGTGGFSPAQRAEIVAVVRNALKTDPTILGDAIIALRASAQQKEDVDAGSAVRANGAALNGQPGDAILGNPSGDVTLVEFYDPRCPYCRKVLPDLDGLLAADRKVRLIEKLIPILGPNSVLDAQAIQAAMLQGKYKSMQQALMSDSGAPGPDRIKTLAASAGLDVPRLLRDMKSDKVNAVLEANTGLAHTLHLTGTPSFIIGDQVIPGAIDLADLRQAVAARRAAR